MDEINDKELFESAVTEAPAEPAPQEAEETGQPRDEHGRFAAKAPEPEPAEQPAPAEQPQQEANVPSWRLREEREAREAAERRFQEAQRDWQRQFQELQGRLPQPEQPKRPDVFENPDGFVEYGVKQAVDPLKSEMSQLREFYSRRDAIREHGQEKVQAAYQALSQGIASRDPEAVAIYQRAMQSMDPFGDIVTWHQQKTVYSQIGNDPSAWFEKTFEERMKDPAFQGKVLQMVQQAPRVPGQQRQNVVQIPPSLNRVAAAASAADEPGSMNDADLYRDAVGR